MKKLIGFAVSAVFLVSCATASHHHGVVTEKLGPKDGVYHLELDEDDEFEVSRWVFDHTNLGDRYDG